MSYYVRKIARNKWPYPTDTGEIEQDINADVLGSCIRTTGNTLSLWEIDDLDKISEVVLAMVSNFEKLDTIVLLIMDKQSVTESGLNLTSTDGETSYATMIKNHRDISELKYSSMGVFINLVLETLVDDANSKRFTTSKVREILKTAVKEGKIKLDQLKENVRRDIEKILNNTN